MLASLPAIACLALAAAACSAADDTPPGPNRAATASEQTPKRHLEAVPYPDVDPKTGVDRKVIYEPQITPESSDPKEQGRKDPGKSAPQR